MTTKWISNIVSHVNGDLRQHCLRKTSVLSKSISRCGRNARWLPIHQTTAATGGLLRQIAHLQAAPNANVIHSLVLRRDFSGLAVESSSKLSRPSKRKLCSSVRSQSYYQLVARQRSRLTETFSVKCKLLQEIIGHSQREHNRRLDQLTVGPKPRTPTDVRPTSSGISLRKANKVIDLPQVDKELRLKKHPRTGKLELVFVSTRVERKMCEMKAQVAEKIRPPPRPPPLDTVIEDTQILTEDILRQVKLLKKLTAQRNVNQKSLLRPLGEVHMVSKGTNVRPKLARKEAPINFVKKPPPPSKVNEAHVECRERRLPNEFRSLPKEPVRDSAMEKSPPSHGQPTDAPKKVPSAKVDEKPAVIPGVTVDIKHFRHLTRTEDPLNECKYCGFAHHSEKERCPFKEALKLFTPDRQVSCKFASMGKEKPYVPAEKLFTPANFQVLPTKNHSTNPRSTNSLKTSMKADAKKKKKKKKKAQLAKCFRPIRDLKPEDVRKVQKCLEDILQDIFKKYGMKKKKAHLLKGNIEFEVDEDAVPMRRVRKRTRHDGLCPKLMNIRASPMWDIKRRESGHTLKPTESVIKISQETKKGPHGFSVKYVMKKPDAAATSVPPRIHSKHDRLEKAKENLRKTLKHTALPPPFVDKKPDLTRDPPAKRRKYKFVKKEKSMPNIAGAPPCANPKSVKVPEPHVKITSECGKKAQAECSTKKYEETIPNIITLPGPSSRVEVQKKQSPLSKVKSASSTKHVSQIPVKTDGALNLKPMVLLTASTRPKSSDSSMSRWKPTMPKFCDGRCANGETKEVESTKPEDIEKCKEETPEVNDQCTCTNCKCGPDCKCKKATEQQPEVAKDMEPTKQEDIGQCKEEIPEVDHQCTCTNCKCGPDCKCKQVAEQRSKIVKDMESTKPGDIEKCKKQLPEEANRQCTCRNCKCGADCNCKQVAEQQPKMVKDMESKEPGDIDKCKMQLPEEVNHKCTCRNCKCGAECNCNCKQVATQRPKMRAICSGAFEFQEMLARTMNVKPCELKFIQARMRRDRERENARLAKLAREQGCDEEAAGGYNTEMAIAGCSKEKDRGPCERNSHSPINTIKVALCSLMKMMKSEGKTEAAPTKDPCEEKCVAVPAPCRCKEPEKFVECQPKEEEEEVREVKPKKCEHVPIKSIQLSEACSKIVRNSRERMLQKKMKCSLNAVKKIQSTPCAKVKAPCVQRAVEPPANKDKDEWEVKVNPTRTQCEMMGHVEEVVGVIYLPSSYTGCPVNKSNMDKVDVMKQEEEEEEEEVKPGCSTQQENRNLPKCGSAVDPKKGRGMSSSAVSGPKRRSSSIAGRCGCHHPVTVGKRYRRYRRKCPKRKRQYRKKLHRSATEKEFATDPLLSHHLIDACCKFRQTAALCYSKVLQTYEKYTN